jgi:hypothetical protein
LYYIVLYYILYNDASIVSNKGRSSNRSAPRDRFKLGFTIVAVGWSVWSYSYRSALRSHWLILRNPSSCNIIVGVATFHYFNNFYTKSWFITTFAQMFILVLRLFSTSRNQLILSPWGAQGGTSGVQKHRAEEDRATSKETSCGMAGVISWLTRCWLFFLEFTLW